MTDRPKKPFNEIANIRDKDNVQPELKPSFSRTPAPNLAPKGMSGIHLSRYDGPVPIKSDPSTKEQKDKPVSIVKTHPNPALLTGGRFLDRPGYGFAVEVNPYRSVAGIEGGRLHTLELQQEGRIVAQYQNMQWTVKPDRQEDIELVERLQNQFGEPRRDFVPIVPLEHDKGHDRDR